eukprot:3633663-Pyramimonas_sp.AAC.1
MRDLPPLDPQHLLNERAGFPASMGQGACQWRPQLWADLAEDGQTAMFDLLAEAECRWPAQ